MLWRHSILLDLELYLQGEPPHTCFPVTDVGCGTGCTTSPWVSPVPREEDPEAEEVSWGAAAAGGI